MSYKIGDKVRVKNGLISWERYNGVRFDDDMKIHCGKEYVIEDYVDDGDISLWWAYDGVGRWRWSSDMLEPVNVKKNKGRHTYERQAVSDDGIVRTPTAIGNRTLKEISDSIQECRDSISRDESLLRRHRSLFSKKR